jgi:phosphate transport system substrate-binding protein
MTMRAFQQFAFLGLVLTFLACGPEKDKKTGKTLDTPTTGELTVYIEEGYKPVIESCIDVFDSIYRLAKIKAYYTSEGEAMKALIDDSVQVAVVSRKLRSDEAAYFQSRGFMPAVTPIAYDAIAFLVNQNNADSVLTIDQIKGILSGALTEWKQINPAAARLGPIRLVFDSPQSGTLRYVIDSVLTGQPLATGATALQSNEEVIDYVRKQKNAIGIISANWISDTDDKGVQAFRNSLRIVDVAKAPGEKAYGPYQVYLANGNYPFKRTVYIINAQARKGLGLGFASFLAGDAQRIFLKDGLLPARAVTRLVQATRK